MKYHARYVNGTTSLAIAITQTPFNPTVRPNQAVKKPMNIIRLTTLIKLVIKANIITQ
jgi:hypothetical protein